MTTDVTHPDVREELVPLTPAERDVALDHEWMLTNGLGGYAMGTLPGCNTRRYHGLLIASAKPPVRRRLVLHSMIEQLIVRDGDERLVDLSTQRFGDTFALHPEGWRHLTGWTLDAWHAQMTWRLAVDDVAITKVLRLTPGRNRATIDYTVRAGDRAVRLRVRPLIPLRDYHELSRRDDRPLLATLPSSDVLCLTRDAERVHCIACADDANREPSWCVEPEWWYDFGYPEDAARGQTYLEDIWSPGSCLLDVPRGSTRTLSISVSLEAPLLRAPVSTVTEDVTLDAPPKPRALSQLRLAADQFIAGRDVDGRWSTTILAGYPWFADWGRDAMISLPGLLLDTDRLTEAHAVLQLFARHRADGLVPNRFDDYGGTPHYNTVDASLWFINGVYAFALAGGRRDALPELLDACEDILHAYEHGTRYGIRMDDDGLITSGDPTTQLTWMDAKRNDIVFTPRHGKAIEINALYHNALRIMAELTPDDAQRTACRERAERLAVIMRLVFWWPEESCCHDVIMPDVNGWHPDGRLRCNQIFAVSVPFSPLTDEQQAGVVAAVRDHLLTPFGLRTLDPRHPDYRGRFEGDLMQRDAAYHNGTAWPWLIGAYCDAVERTSSDVAAARHQQRNAISSLIGELDRDCLHQLAEVYDGDAPHRPAGCPAQAWSVAEVHRIARRVYATA